MLKFKLIDYNKEGKGVSKNEVTTKPKLFIRRFLNSFWNLVLLNILYVICCIPVITIGPATAAMTQIVKNYGMSYPVFMFTDFFEAFKENFKKGVLLTIIDILAGVLFYLSARFYYANMKENKIYLGVFILVLCVGVLVFMMHFYIYPMLVSVNLKFKEIIKNSFILTIVELKANLIVLSVFALFIALIVMFFPYTAFFILFLPFTCVSFISCYIIYPKIQKHVIDPHNKDEE